MNPPDPFGFRATDINPDLRPPPARRAGRGAVIGLLMLALALGLAVWQLRRPAPAAPPTAARTPPAR